MPLTVQTCSYHHLNINTSNLITNTKLRNIKKKTKINQTITDNRI